MTQSNPLIDKLRSVEARYEELNQQLATPEVVSDSKRYQKAAKAHSDLSEIVSKFREYKDLERGIAETRSMVSEVESDPDLKKMAEEELATLEAALCAMRSRSEGSAAAQGSERRTQHHPGNPRRNRR